jgi:hypothetical protein
VSLSDERRFSLKKGFLRKQIPNLKCPLGAEFAGGRGERKGEGKGFNAGDSPTADYSQGECNEKCSNKDGLSNGGNQRGGSGSNNGGSGVNSVVFAGGTSGPILYSTLRGLLALEFCLFLIVVHI